MSDASATLSVPFSTETTGNMNTAADLHWVTIRDFGAVCSGDVPGKHVFGPVVHEATVRHVSSNTKTTNL
jgi:hypothetical protein